MMMDLHDVDGTEVIAKEAQNDFMRDDGPIEGSKFMFPKSEIFSFIVFRTLYFSKENTSENK